MPPVKPLARVPPGRGAVEHGSSIDIAFQHIRELIVFGKLAPGTWIIEAELSQKLGMSRTPIRGALQWLQREGYVIEQKAKLNSRMMVAPLTGEDARELYAIVARIEGLAGRQTATLPKAERMEIASRIRAINAELDLIAKTRDLNKRNIFDLDMQFHRIIVEAGAGPRLLLLHDGVKPQTERYWRLYANNILDQLHLAVGEHERIIRAIQKGDAPVAESALITNWVNGADRIAGVIETQGERGIW
ncbi:MAG TPA: GntR family transcriptional regulator [Acidobacteriaceae bacterium]|jgi:DNA-binding GntR family transcriptional regulator|nr:GntR family transcriptional regulator [Acidobacteriaceae bacterium]